MELALSWIGLFGCMEQAVGMVKHWTDRRRAARDNPADVAECHAEHVGVTRDIYRCLGDLEALRSNQPEYVEFVLSNVHKHAAKVQENILKLEDAARMAAHPWFVRRLLSAKKVAELVESCSNDVKEANGTLVDVTIRSIHQYVRHEQQVSKRLCLPAFVPKVHLNMLECEVRFDVNVAGLVQHATLPCGMTMEDDHQAARLVLNWLDHLKQEWKQRVNLCSEFNSGGIYTVFFAEDMPDWRLKAQLAGMVRESGNPYEATLIRNDPNLDSAIDRTAEWFRNTACLFSFFCSSSSRSNNLSRLFVRLAQKNKKSVTLLYHFKREVYMRTPARISRNTSHGHTFLSIQ